MDIRNMHDMIEMLVGCAKSELFEKGISAIDSEEFEEVTRSIKNLAEARYYQTLTKAMEKAEYGKEYDEDGPMEEDERKGYRGQPRSKTSGRYMKRGDGRRGYDEKMPMHEEDPEYMRDMDRDMHGRMYYTDMGGQHSSHMQRDEREGRSGEARRGYMESKEMHKGNSSEEKQKKMKELEKYMNELSSDITEMISDASPEEKNMLKAKLTTLSSKIS